MCKTVMTEQSEIEKTVLDSLLCDDLLEKAPHIASEIIEKNVKLSGDSCTDIPCKGIYADIESGVEDPNTLKELKGDLVKYWEYKKGPNVEEGQIVFVFKRKL